jgi:hypothetical protein
VVDPWVTLVIGSEIRQVWEPVSNEIQLVDPLLSMSNLPTSGVHDETVESVSVLPTVFVLAVKPVEEDVLCTVRPPINRTGLSGLPTMRNEIGSAAGEAGALRYEIVFPTVPLIYTDGPPCLRRNSSKVNMGVMLVCPLLESLARPVELAGSMNQAV